MFSNTLIEYDDEYLRPAFSLRNKVKRLIWQISWFWICRWTPKPLHKWRCFVLRFFGAKIGKSNFIYPDCKIWAPWLLETEDVVTIGSGAEIYNPGMVYLGHHTIISQGAYLCGATHDYNSKEFTYLKKKIITESYVWICARAVVLPGVVCKEGSVLGASSITNKNLSSWSIYAGNPAVFIKSRVNFTIKN